MSSSGGGSLKRRKSGIDTLIKSIELTRSGVLNDLLNSNNVVVADGDIEIKNVVQEQEQVRQDIQRLVAKTESLQSHQSWRSESPGGQKKKIIFFNVVCKYFGF